MKNFTVEVVVCVNTSMFLFLEWMFAYSNKKVNKSIVFVFSSTYSLFAASLMLIRLARLTPEFLQEETQLFSNESTLWTIFQRVENWLSFIHNWFLDTTDLQTPDWTCCSPLTTFHLISGMEISHIHWRVESRLLQANRPWIIRWTLCVNRLVFSGIHRFLFSQPGHFTYRLFEKPSRPQKNLLG